MKWQVGYQRSGNKWLCYLIVNMLTERAPESRSEYQRLLPNHVDVVGGKARARLGWVRSHVAYNRAVHSPFGFDGGICVVRHPLAVAVSAFAYRVVVDAHQDVSMWTAEQYIARVRAYISYFIEHRGDPAFNSIVGGNWAASNSEWLDIAEKRNDVLIVRYRDLLGTPHETLGRVTRVLMPAVTEVKLAAAVLAAQQTRTDNLTTPQAQVPSTPPVTNFSDLGFVPRGAADAWQDIVTDEQRRDAERAFGDAASALGYTF